MQRPLIRIVDDDAEMRESLEFLLSTEGWKSRSYASAEAFLETDDVMVPGCLILDIRMPGMTGVELQRRLFDAKCTLPVIFLTGHGDVNMAVHALQHGAFDFLQKPVDPEKLNEVVSRAVEHSIALHEQTRSEEMIRALYDSLTAREQDVVKLAAMDMSNKDIGEKLFISLPTVKMHRSSAFTKLGVKSALEAYWMLETIGVVEKGAGRSRD